MGEGAAAPLINGDGADGTDGFPDEFNTETELTLVDTELGVPFVVALLAAATWSKELPVGLASTIQQHVIASNQYVESICQH